MTSNAFINKHPKQPPAKDYEFLRQRAMEYIRRHAASTWTDHNIHDPGITTLEILCYAMTELGYRADFDISTLLAENTLIDQKIASQQPKQERKQELPKDKKQQTDSFFQPQDILTCNPLTVIDWRKLIIDIPMINNAWFLPTHQYRPEIFLNSKKGRKKEKLSYLPDKKQRHPIVLNGLFNIQLAFERHPSLGNLNSWQFTFDLTTSGLKPATLYISPNWRAFFENQLKISQFNHAYFETLNSSAALDSNNVPSTALYHTRLILSDGVSRVGFAVNVTSPLEKTDNNKAFIDDRLSQQIEAIAAFVRDRVTACVDIVANVQSQVHKHRNLGEDLVSIIPCEQEEIGICVEIEIKPESDLAKVMSQVHHQLDNHLDPQIPFYSLAQILEPGFNYEHIFNGPLLNNGFTRDEDLINAAFKSHLYSSDIIQVLMDIEGIKAVNNLQLSRYFNGELLATGEPWCLSLNNQRSLKFSWQKSRIIFYKGLLPYKAPVDKTLEHLNDLRAIANRGRAPIDFSLLSLLSVDSQSQQTSVPKLLLDPAPNQTPNQTLNHYQSIQHEFPLVYAIGTEGVAKNATSLRKAQAKQLKGFLTLIDQLLTNFSAQLANIKHLFSLDGTIQKTYFSQLLFSLPETYQLQQSHLQKLIDSGLPTLLAQRLQPLVEQQGLPKDAFIKKLATHLNEQEATAYQTDIVNIAKIPAINVPNTPNVESILADFVKQVIQEHLDIDDKDSYQTQWQSYKVALKNRYWQHLCDREPKLESSATYADRRNRFLDHMLARFAEQFTDYVLLNTSIDELFSPAELINHKISLLNDYPSVSHNRGKGFNYLSLNAATNVTGIEHRASRLLGINSWQRQRFTAPLYEIFEQFDEQDNDGITEWRFRLRDNKRHILFSSTNHYEVTNALEDAMEATLFFGAHRNNYHIRTNKNNRYYFVLVDEQQDILMINRKYEDSRANVEQRIQDTINHIGEYQLRREGFHLVEHILLRPIDNTSQLFNIALEDNSPGFKDPYSFRATAVVPGWLDRYRNTSYRQFFEQTLRAEAPAHIHLKICWVDKPSMAIFEDNYFKWLTVKAQPKYTLSTLIHLNDELKEATDNLLESLQSLTSIYQQTRLFDCQREGDKQSILLNHSKLGSSKGN